MIAYITAVSVIVSIAFAAWVTEMLLRAVRRMPGEERDNPEASTYTPVFSAVREVYPLFLKLYAISITFFWLVSASVANEPETWVFTAHDPYLKLLVVFILATSALMGALCGQIFSIIADHVEHLLIRKLESKFQKRAEAIQ